MKLELNIHIDDEWPEAIDIIMNEIDSWNGAQIISHSITE